ncbi:MAG TPA: DHH family phosphoesterase, partial [Bacteroidia bacterium]|nr:DHH family phosphoesterase [Bacteroidia bacterium]
MTKRWRIHKEAPSAIIEPLAKEINVPPVVANLLYQRGISNYEEAKRFFRPKLEYLYSPFQMQDMHKAVSRVEQAIAKGEKILVYGDYDVDGTTAVALLFSFLKSFYSNVEYYIPDRYKEGYGISTAGIDFAAINGFSLIIALDCGIKAIDKINYANKKNIDFIICDHHLP